MTDQTSTVPFLDLRLQNRRIAEDVAVAIAGVVERGDFVLGAAVAAFEEDFAEFCEVQHCVGVANGTDALELALRSVGVGDRHGDEVIIPANTFVATAEAVLRAGAVPVFADCTRDHLLDPASVAEHLGPRTRAVVPVHLYGQVAPVKVLRDVVGDDVLLVEDAAQAQGASRDGRRAGSLGAVAATSFYPGKNLGAYGDAGAVLTDCATTAARVRALRNHGGTAKYEHLVVGTNSRLDSIQAAVLSIKLRHLDAWNRERAAAAETYDRLLSEVDKVDRPGAALGNDHVWHLYVVEVPDRDEVLSALTRAGIGAGVHYPAPVHLLPAFAGLGRGRGSMPVTERASARILSLPMFPGITVQQQERVVAALSKAVR